MRADILDEIKTYISDNRIDIAEQYILEHENKLPNDYDLLIVKALLQLKKNDLDTAYSFAKLAIEKNRLNLDANLSIAVVCEKQEKWLESYTYYSRLYALQEKFEIEVLNNENLLSSLDNTIKKMAEHLKTLNGVEAESYYREMNAVNQVETDILKNMFHINEDVDNFFGKHYLYDSDYFFARYDDWFHSYFKPHKASNATESKTEIIKIRDYGTEYTYNEEVPCIVPCILNMETYENHLTFTNAKLESHIINDTIVKTCSYFKLNGKTTIKGEHPIAFGEPILLDHSKDRKKLVLSIFLDSFNYKFLEEHPLQEVMPNTSKFFSEGILCTNAYVGSEFTYPSVPSYWTGMRSNNHKMLNPKLYFAIPDDIKLLSEYFKEAGYFTSKIGGNYSVVPNFGYLKGIDRFVFERWAQNFNVQQVVCETIEHIETYKDTDQFVWMDIGDLHDVAGGWQRPSSVQVKAPYSAREIDNTGGSTLFQSFSPNKREIYKEELYHIDLYLNMLYQYIKEHYSKDEVVISFFSDHGNGFNVQNGQPFVSDQRMKVPMMFYGSWQGERECKEIIESIDYSSILCNMAGVDMNSKRKIDGHLPAFFGGRTKKEYAIAQSIYPDQTYKVAIFNENLKFYLETENTTRKDCKIDISKIRYALLADQNDNLIKDENAINTFTEIVLELIQDFNMHI